MSDSQPMIDMSGHEFPTDCAAECRLRNDPGFEFGDLVGGVCPVQICFTIDGFDGYFRARWSQWRIDIAHDGASALDDDPQFVVEGDYEGERTASWMPLAEAMEIVENSIAALRCQRVNG